MLHELLFALNGCPGDIFILNDDKQLVVDPALPFISKAEKFVLEDLLVLGTHYLKIVDFLADHSQSCGKYTSALCDSVQRSIGYYESCLVRLENELLNDSGLTLAHVHHSLRCHVPVLHALVRLCDDVRGARRRGCLLLDTVQRHVMQAVSSQRQHLEQAQRACWRALCSQLCSWMMHGVLVDSSHELFIRRRRQNSNPTSDTAAAHEEPDAAALPVEAKLARLARLSATASGAGIDEYELRADMMPNCLPVGVCEDIVFVGSMIQLCRGGQQAGVDGDIERDSSRDALAGREDQLTAQLQQLAECVSLSSLEHTVSHFKRAVGRHLWTLVVRQGELSRHVQVITDFLLVGNGAIFQQLYVECGRVMSAPVSSTTSSQVSLETDINAALLTVCAKLGVQDDAVLDNLQLCLVPASCSSSADLCYWDLLRVRYCVPWQLRLLFTTPAFNCYDRLFSFLLLVKRTQMQLHQAWLCQLRNKQRTRHARDSLHVLIFLVNSIQHYLLVDVVQSELASFAAVIGDEERRDFSHVRVCHDSMLARLTEQCFMHVPALSQCLQQLLALCRNVAAILTVNSSSNRATSSGQIQQQSCEQLYQQILVKAQLMFRLLSGVSEQKSTGKHLSRLLHRLDVNHYFSQQIMNSL